MTNSKSTKRALWASVLSIVICLTMLIGSTFAWFTDTATTGVNTIKSGNLDVDLVNESGVSVANGTLKFVDKDDNIYWEPGCTYTLENVYVENKGNLALKYQIKVTGITGDAKLLEAIEWTMNGFDMDTEYSLEAGQKSSALSITGHMKETAGNEYKNLELNGIAITVYATQYTSEYDSYNNTYDKNAEYGNSVTQPDNLTATPKTAAELKTILDTAFTGGSVEGVVTVNLTDDFDLANEWTTAVSANYSGVNTVVINGNGHYIKNLNQPLIEGTFGGSGTLTFNDLTIKDSTISAAGGSGVGIGVFMNNADASSSVTFNNCAIDNVNITNTADNSTLGGFIGYSSADTLTFTNCSVTGSTFVGTKDIGAFVGYTQSAVTATNAVITGNTITSSNDSTYRVGAIAGTFNVNASTITTNDVSNNTVTQTDASTAKISDYAGRILADVTVDSVALTKNS